MIVDTTKEEERNLASLQSVMMTYHPQGTQRPAYYLYDNFGYAVAFLDGVYDGTKLLEKVMLNLAETFNDPALNILEHAAQNVGMYINGKWFDWEKIKYVWGLDPAAQVWRWD